MLRSSHRLYHFTGRSREANSKTNIIDRPMDPVVGQALQQIARVKG